MYRPAVRGVRRLGHGFRQRRVRVDGPRQLLDRALQAERDGGLGHELRGARPDHVHPENLIVLLLGHDLHEALGLARDLRPAEGEKRERAHDHVVAPLLRLAFGQADAADLGIAIRARRHVVVVERPDFASGDPLGHRDSLGRRQVRKLRMPGPAERDDIADRRDAGYVRAVLLVHADIPLLEREAHVLDAETIRYRTAPGGDEQVLRGTLLDLPVRQLHLEVDAARARLRACDRGARLHRDALLAKRLLQLRRDGLVLERDEAGQQLEERDLAPEPAEDRRELDADRTCAQNGQRLRHVSQVDRLVARDDARPIDLDARHAARRGAGRHDNLARLKRLRLAAAHLHAAAARQTRAALDPVDLVLLEQELDAFGETLDDLVLAGLHAGHVDRRALRGVAERDAPLLRVLHDLERVRVLEQRLRGDAAPIEARAAERRLALDHGHVQAELGGADRGDVAAGARADNQDVVGVRHGAPSVAVFCRAMESPRRARRTDRGAHGVSNRRDR